MTAKHCAHCSVELAKAMRCSQCKTVCYCSRECQKQHWGSHKSQCKALALALLATESPFAEAAVVQTRGAAGWAHFVIDGKDFLAVANFFTSGPGRQPSMETDSSIFLVRATEDRTADRGAKLSHRRRTRCGPFRMLGPSLSQRAQLLRRRHARAEMGSCCESLCRAAADQERRRWRSMPSSSMTAAACSRSPNSTSASRRCTFYRTGASSRFNASPLLALGPLQLWRARR